MDSIHGQATLVPSAHLDPRAQLEGERLEADVCARVGSLGGRLHLREARVAASAAAAPARSIGLRRRRAARSRHRPLCQQLLRKRRERPAAETGQRGMNARHGLTHTSDVTTNIACFALIHLIF
eukprot:2207022-Pleurochrysis_carterae.AAC.2